MGQERQLFFLPENEQNILSLFKRKLEIGDHDGLRTCVIKSGEVEKLRKAKYAIGKEIHWSVKGFPEEKRPAIYIKNHPVHLHGIFISSYSAEDGIFHLRSRTIDEITKATRIEYDGTLRDAFSMYTTLESSPNPPLVIHRAKNYESNSTA